MKNYGRQQGAYLRSARKNTRSYAFSPAVSKEINKKIHKKFIKDSEKKYIDVSANTSYPVTYVGINNQATSLPLSEISQTVGPNGRIGLEVMPTSIRVAYNLYWHNNANTTDGNTVRVMLIRWNLTTNGPSYPVAGSILQQTGQYQVVNSAYTWVPKHSNDYQVLYDKRHKCSYSDQTSSGIIRVKGSKLHKITYETSSNQGTYHYFLIAVSDDSGIVSRISHYRLSFSYQYIDA